MKKTIILFLLTIFSIVLFTGCTTVNKVSSSYMVRSSGIGETAVPIGNHGFAVELFNDKATSIDVISVNKFQLGTEQFGEYYITSGKESQRDRYYGGNFRFGFGNYTELKLGLFQGSIYESPVDIDLLDESGNILSLYQERYTSFGGGHIGLKRLLTHHTNPHKLSLYVEGKRIRTETDGLAGKYDGINTEFKTALIYGYLRDTSSRNFPSLALFHSLANTQRSNTVDGIKANKHPQAIGAEINLNLALRMVYANLSTGIEKEIGHNKATDEIKPYFGVKFGVHFNRNASKSPDGTLGRE